MCTLAKDECRTDDIWERSVIAAHDAGVFGAWKGWIRARP